MAHIVSILDRLDRQIFMADEAQTAVEKAMAFEACSLLIDQLEAKLGSNAGQLREKSANLREAITAMIGARGTEGRSRSQHLGWALTALQSMRIRVIENCHR